MRRPKPTAESKARAQRIAQSLAGLLNEPPAPAPEVDAGERRVHAPRPAGDGTLSCPCCAARMERVGTGQGVEVDQCLECGAVWMDAGELEELLRADVGSEASGERPAATVAELRARMATVVREDGETEIRYRGCPRCGEMMNRRNFGTISGIVVDECPRHGVLLDEGELQAIEAFVRMGGAQLGERARIEQGQRSVPPPPDPLYGSVEGRPEPRSIVRDSAIETAGETIWNLLFRW